MQKENKETANELAALEKKFDIMINYLAEIHYFLTFKNKLSPSEYYEEFRMRHQEIKDAESAAPYNCHADVLQSPDTPQHTSQ